MTPDFFKHSHAICETTDVGSGTRIWAFAHVLPGARVGANCNICDGVFIENDVVIGNRVTIKNGVFLYDGVRIEDDVFIGPGAAFANDLFPRSKQYQAENLKTIVRRGASIGSNATLLPGIEVGEGAMIGAGAVVNRSVPPFAVVVGNPARITGYAKEAPSVSASPAAGSGEADDLVKIKRISDLRGNLTAGEFPKDIPFLPKRYFTISGVPSQEVRGEHAHKVCQQFLICLRGSCHALLDDGSVRKEYVLDRPDVGLFIPPMIWGTQHKYTQDAILLVFASDYYDPDDYIRSYDVFKELTKG